MAVAARKLTALEDRGPLRVMFLTTSMPVGGAEVLLVNLIRRMDRERFVPSLCCLKTAGPLGEELAEEIPVFSHLIRHKLDVGVIGRLTRLFREERIDAVVTVGAGDKMFWGRIAARRADVPVILCAVHSTGWPDAITRLNRLPFLTRWTDGFIGVAQAHGQHLVEKEGFPANKVHVITNGVDTCRFHPSRDNTALRYSLGISPTAPVAGIVAALRPEKDHELFLKAAGWVRRHVRDAHFLIVGDGPLRAKLEAFSKDLGLTESVRFLGTRSDIPELLSAMDVFVLTSKIEANPVSILEAMATGKPVIAPRVGSISESVIDGLTGFLTTAGDEHEVAERLSELFATPELARRLGRSGRQVAVDRWSLDRMVEGYQDLIARTYWQKSRTAELERLAADTTVLEQPAASPAPRS